MSLTFTSRAALSCSTLAWSRACIFSALRSPAAPQVTRGAP